MSTSTKITSFDSLEQNQLRIASRIMFAFGGSQGQLIRYGPQDHQSDLWRLNFVLSIDEIDYEASIDFQFREGTVKGLQLYIPDIENKAIQDGIFRDCMHCFNGNPTTVRMTFNYNHSSLNFGPHCIMGNEYSEKMLDNCKIVALIAGFNFLDVEEYFKGKGYSESREVDLRRGTYYGFTATEVHELQRKFISSAELGAVPVNWLQMDSHIQITKTPHSTHRLDTAYLKKIGDA